MEEFNAVSGAYYILRKLRDTIPESKKFLDKDAIKLIAQDVSSSTKSDINTKFNMGVKTASNPIQAYRDTVLHINDAFQLLALWDWLNKMRNGGDVDAYGKTIVSLATSIKDMIKHIEGHQEVYMDHNRSLLKSIVATYVANMPNAVNELGEDIEDAYKIRTNMLLKYYLDLPTLFILEGED
ncbi:unknown [Lactobacillus phage Lb338-1]|uniref:Uncharacterized protein n=1 Tax=Lactobacillus phage Lb338-1 TaxID=2892342 RepID=C1KFQ7_9CAUD|nr:hypothetical protein lb338_phage_147 [Lactobacillus phage Lb338-1]ACO37068.1 unknown [Lactobacillus phage Lb338-1]